MVAGIIIAVLDSGINWDERDLINQYHINQEELEFMKSQGAYDKKNNRTRDKFTVYVEARARYGLLMKQQARSA